MALKYDFFAVNELNNTQGKYRARAVSLGKVSTDKLAKWISQTSALSTAQAKSSIEIITEGIMDYIVNGYEVEVGKLGYFSASVTSELVDNPTDIRAESVRFNKLNFRASAQIKRRIKAEGVEKVSKPRYKRKLKTFTLEERAAKLKKHLKTNPFITRSGYAEIMRIPRNSSAIQDLNAFIEEGWLQRHGAGRTVIYMLKKQE